MCDTGEERTTAAGPERTSTVLVVDDEETFHDSVVRHLKGFRVLNAYNGWQALDALDEHHVDVVLLDLKMPGLDGFEVLDRMRDLHEDVEVIVVTAHSELPNAVKAVKKGAFDFVAKSYESYKQLGQYVDRALLHRRRKWEHLERVSHRWWLDAAFGAMKRSKSESFRAMLKVVDQVAQTPLTVLLEGESGVGKEILARYVHAASDRDIMPFVAIDLSAVPPTLLDSHLFGHVKGSFSGADKTHVGKFEMADGGTLFLDEIGTLTESAQVKLLRVLQEREIERLGAHEATPVDVRLIAATNADLKAKVKEGRFREDLFFRLDVVRLTIPPLRERKPDLPVLVDLLFAKHARIMRRDPPTLSRDAMLVLAEHDWPGNVRELENLLMRLVAVHPGEEIDTDDIPTEYCLQALHTLACERAAEDEQKAREHGLYFLAREQFERYLVRLMVSRCGGDKRAAAAELGVSYSTIKGKLRGGDQGGGKLGA